MMLRPALGSRTQPLRGCRAAKTHHWPVAGQPWLDGTARNGSLTQDATDAHAGD
jgi:hypothetical protein